MRKEIKEYEQVRSKMLAHKMKIRVRKEKIQLRKDIKEYEQVRKAECLRTE